MPQYRRDLPQLAAPLFLTDGGIETSLIHDQGFELPEFAAFVLLETVEGRRGLWAYFEPYLKVALREGVGIVLETATWRASPDWGARLGFTSSGLIDIDLEAVALLAAMRERYEAPHTPVVISGCIGPRGDGYRADGQMSRHEASVYHRPQVRAFAASSADLVTAITMTYSAEAIGIAQAAADADVPVVISFTVETDGRLPSGETLGEAIETTDAATGAAPAYYMINCAHPSHFSTVLAAGAPWAERVGGLRANASALSHAELDEAEQLDTGDPDDLSRRYRELWHTHPALRVLGGCCGTNHQHIDAIATACRTESV